jgi:hypothetical protein
MNELNQLQKRIDEFEKFTKQIDRRQLDFPLDKGSQVAINEDVLVPTGGVVFPYTLVAFDESIEVDINGRRYYIYSTSKQ